MKIILRLLPLLALCLYPSLLKAQIFFGTADSAFVWQDSKNAFVAADDHSAVMLSADENASPATLATTDLNPASVCHWHLHFSMCGAFTAYNYSSLFLAASLNRDGSVKEGLCVRFGGSNNKTVSLVKTDSSGNQVVLCESPKNTLRPNYPFSMDIYRESISSDPDNPSFRFSVYCDISNENVLICQSDDISIPIDYFSSHPYTAIEIVFTKTYASGKTLITDFKIKNCEQQGTTPYTPTDPKPTPEPDPKPDPIPTPVPDPEPVPDPVDFVCLRSDVVINEIMYHPTADFGLPEIEWVELYNNTDNLINLSDWTWLASSSLPQSSIEPHGYVLLCSKKYAEALSSWSDCPVYALSSWPELNNSAKCLYLSDSAGRIVDYVYYDNSAFKDNFKAQGGWSLERIDGMNENGSMSNWAFSTNEVLGATPGSINSVCQTNVDSDSPSCLYALLADNSPNSLRLCFSEPMDTVNIPSSVDINDKPYAFSLSQANRFALNWMDISVDRVFEQGVYYTLSLSDFRDLAGNPIVQEDIKFGFADSVSTNDVVINEIMAKASPSSHDYLELYNRSHKNIDIYELCIASLNDDLSIKSLSPVISYHKLLFPSEYLVVTKDSLGVVEAFSPSSPANVVSSTKFPALPAEGAIALSSRNGSVVDLVEYDNSLLSPLSKGLHNVSLERVNPNAPSTEKSNWCSASDLSGYATPTERNSHYRSLSTPTEELIAVTTKVFSPRSPNEPNCAVISTQFTDGSWFASLQVFSPEGYLVATPYNNALLPSSGNLSWNGSDDSGKLQPPGTYIVYLSAWQTAGRTKYFKSTVTILSE